MRPLTLAAGLAALFLSACLFSHTVALRLLLLLGAAALVAAALAKEPRGIRLLPPLWLPFVMYAAWAACSMAWSLEPERTSKEIRNEIGYAALALWVCHAAAQARNAARIMMLFLAGGATLVCALAIYHFPQGPERYARGLHGGAGNHASALLALMPCALMAGWYAARARVARWSMWLPWALVGLFLVAAYTTLNRTIWLGFATQLLIVGVLLRMRGKAAVDLRTRVIAIAVGVAVVTGGVAVTLQVQAEREASGAARTLAHDPRFALWPEILERIGERPFTGYGFGRGILRKSLREDFDDLNLWHSHNLLLDTQIQLGLPGLVLLLVLLGAIVRAGWRGARQPDDAATACGIALIAMVAGMLVRNMTDVLWVRQNALLFWGIAGVLLAWSGALRATVR